MTAPLDDEAMLQAFKEGVNAHLAGGGERGLIPTRLAGLRAVAEAAVGHDWEDPETANPWRGMACRSAHERNEQRKRAEAAEREAERLRAAAAASVAKLDAVVADMRRGTLGALALGIEELYAPLKAALAGGGKGGG